MDVSTLAAANAMPKDQNKIVRFTNITNFDFTPEMGAMYGGVPYFVSSGKSLLMPMPVGRHLAKHLARQIILQKTPLRTEKELDGKGSDRKLWDENNIRELMTRIISEVYEEEPTRSLSEAEITAKKIRELNQLADEEIAGSTLGYKDKSEVVAELRKRDIPFDARRSKAELEKLLTDPDPTEKAPAL